MLINIQIKKVIQYHYIYIYISNYSLIKKFCIVYIGVLN